MNVEILDKTPAPIDLISVAMGTCYAKQNSSEERVRRAFKAQHMSVFEHAKFTVRIEGVSRALTHQLVRHRMASFCQESQRYVKMDTEGCGWYTIPSTIKYSDNLKLYAETMAQCAAAYQRLLDAGIPAEDARYVLPNATRSILVMTMNLREFYHFYELRSDSYAQWEIRELANQIWDALAEDDQWWWLLHLANSVDETR